MSSLWHFDAYPLPATPGAWPGAQDAPTIRIPLSRGRQRVWDRLPIGDRMAVESHAPGGPLLAVYVIERTGPNRRGSAIARPLSDAEVDEYLEAWPDWPLPDPRTPPADLDDAPHEAPEVSE